MKPIDVAIAGCGIAGLATALLLHRDGHKVTLFERFEKPRPIGSGLMIQPTGLAVLRELGLAEAVLARGSRIDRLFGQAADSGRTVLDVHYAALKRDAFGTGIHRAALFETLYQPVLDAGIAIERGRTVTAAEPLTGGRRRLTFADGTGAGPFDLVVEALGARSGLASEPTHPLAYGALWATLDWPATGDFDAAALQQRYRHASRMAGVMPAGEGRCTFFWSLRGAELTSWREGGLNAWKAEVIALWPQTAPLLDQITDPDQLTFATYAHRTLAMPAARGLIHLGDAWHSTSPQLGQGANMALLDAFALAVALRNANSIDTAVERAIALRHRHVVLYQAMSALFTPVYQSDSRILPWLRDWLVGPLSKRWPATRLQAAMVSGLVGAPLGKLAL